MGLCVQSIALADDSSEGSGGVLERVVVTAQHSEQDLSVVPISISVLDGAAIDSATFTSVNDALHAVPGLVMFEQSQAGLSKMAIRGVSANPSFFNSSSTVGYYLDEIPFAFVRFPLVPDTGAYDVERIEVLRGPQGTLYGANSLNGVVRVLTRDANLDEVEFKVRTTMSSTKDGGENYRGDAALSLPLIPGKLGARFVAGVTDNSGWIDQPLTGRKDVNDSEQENYRLKLNAAPVENLNVEFLTWLYRENRGALSISRDDRTSAAGNRESFETEYDAFGLTVTYDFPAATLLSSTNRLTFTSESVLNSPVGFTGPLDSALTHVGAELTSQEFRLASTGAGSWRWSAGAIYRDETDSQKFDFLSPTIAVGLSGLDYSQYQSKSYALFGELTRIFLDNKLELTGGLRYFEDETSSNEISSLTLQPPFGRRTDKFDSLTPRVVVTYLPSDDTTFYASFAQGFRSGFAQTGAVLRLSQGGVQAVRPDKLSNYELGTKGSFAGGRFSYDLSVYYIDWKDTVQVVSSVVGPVTVNSALNTQGIVGPGVDLATTLRLTDALDFTLTASWNDLGFKKDVRSGAAILYPKDSRPPQSSETTGGFGVNYEVTLPNQYTGRFSGSVNYVSKMTTAAATTAASLVGDDITMARASFTVDSPAGWSAMLFVDNLTDENGRVQPAAPTNPLSGSDRLRPRTYGVQLDYHFN